MPVGERIAFFAERFLGTPYDTDPEGRYVTERLIVADETVDCMYHVFRSVELAAGGSPEGALAAALEKRFITRGRLDENGLVANYGERFRYGEDMLESGRWGAEITGSLGPLAEMEGSKGREKVRFLTKETLSGILEAGGHPELKSGDIVFFIKRPALRVVGEIVGHIGILKKEDGEVFLIHAGGTKGKGGEVRKLPLSEYLADMPFAGVRINRFEESGIEP